MEDLKYLIIYHKEDNDGLFSAALSYAYLYYELGINELNIHYYSANYNDMSKITEEEIDKWTDIYKAIIMVDISFDIKKMKKLYSLFGFNFVWIDHHLPIIKESFKHKFDCISGSRSTDRSALMLTYKFFFDPLDEKYNNRTCPELFRILSAYDSWSYEREGYTLDYVMAVNKAVTYTFKLDPQKVIDFVYKVIYTDTIGTKDIGAFWALGNSFIEYDKVNYESLVNYYGDFSWTIDKGDVKEPICVLFYQAPTGSYVFESCKERVKHGAIFKRLPSGNWVLSLYNTKDDVDFHCGEYCKKKYKGGGHKGAAGCTISEKQFLKIMKNKRI